MANFNPTIFRAYDIRGVFPDDFDASFAQRLGERVVSHLHTGTLIVGRDARASSDAIAYALIDGAVHAGAHVVDVGVLSTPQFAWTIRALGAAGGVMVTASHNPTQFNGFKVIVRRGDTLDVLGGDAIRQMYDAHGHGHRSGGSIEYHDSIPDYAAAVAYAARWTGGTELRMSLDAPDAVVAALRRLGPIAPDDGFAVRCDADGDRISFYDHGVQVPADFIFLMLAEQYRYEPLVFDLRFSKTVAQRLRARGVAFTVSKVGRLHLTQGMHATGAAFGGEMSGHYYWKDMGGMESPELTLLRVYQLLASSGHSLAEFIAPYRILHKSDEISISVHDQKRVAGILKAVAQEFPRGAHSALDGLTIEYPDWWLNIRASHTEAAVRLVVEAKKKDLLDRVVKEVTAIAHS